MSYIAIQRNMVLIGKKLLTGVMDKFLQLPEQ